MGKKTFILNSQQPEAHSFNWSEQTPGGAFRLIRDANQTEGDIAERNVNMGIEAFVKKTGSDPTTPKFAQQVESLIKQADHKKLAKISTLLETHLINRADYAMKSTTSLTHFQQARIMMLLNYWSEINIVIYNYLKTLN